jgi:hypothetical protein
MDDTESNGSFKVTDRRRFSAEGSPKDEPQKEGSPTAEEASKETPEQTQAAASGAAEQTQFEEGPETAKSPPSPEDTEDLPPVDFTGLVVSLANSALIQLGLVGLPDSGKVARNLPAAKQTIDIVAMLEEKTKGNLSDEEQQLLRETLFQLRMAFVEASKK